MAIYELTSDSLRQLDETSFAKAGVRERTDLQRLLRSKIEIVSPGTLIISEEFGEWEDSRRRIDLLGIDQEANLVVIELKRNEDGEEMELQAVRYAAMVSTMTFEKAAEVYATYLSKINGQTNARESILSFLGWTEPNEDVVAQDVRIVLVSADFSKEVTTAVMWLNERDLDIRCIRIKPYRDAEKILVDVQQIIPLPEAAEYQIKIREKERKERHDRVVRGDRVHISEEDFFVEFNAKRSPAEQLVARQLIAWARNSDLRDNFRRGSTGVAFIPVLEHGSYVYYPMSLRSQGWVSLQLRWLKDRPPFSDQQKREELFCRIKAIPGLSATELAMDGFPKFPITSLTEPNTFGLFTSTLDWLVKEIEALPSLPQDARRSYPE